ncbi:hypothetical protein RIB2604_03300400 [Aspergillus luchuensis]|uniref:Uncharacterized protein n=1 Tax=Aspergillus kawachii TaxID=1069201 RepID=A0A146FXJ5_ASPKA|nr:hypothetical protein RIB2604_03300400 [Aspergillus luchuensis]
MTKPSAPWLHHDRLVTQPYILSTPNPGVGGGVELHYSSKGSTNKHAIVVSYHSAIEEANLTKGEGAAVADDGDPEDPPDDYIHHTGTRMTLSHIQHCFDYLRQTLMCAADTNLEVLDPVTHVTSGWGQPKQCRDYRSVVAWAEKWANSSDTGILT